MAYDERTFLGRIDWAAIVASVVTGLGVTLLLVVIGAAVGIVAAEGADAGAVSTAVGGWTVLSALIGTFVGTYLGGRVSRAIQPGSPLFHGLTSWSLVTITAVWLGVSGVAGLLGAGLQAGAQVGAETGLPEAEQVPTEAPAEALGAIAWGGWALAIGLVLTLGLSILGWWVGERTRPTVLDVRDADRAATRERATAETRP